MIRISTKAVFAVAGCALALTWLTSGVRAQTSADREAILARSPIKAQPATANTAFDANGFQDRRFQPLTHSSIAHFTASGSGSAHNNFSLPFVFRQMFALGSMTAATT